MDYGGVAGCVCNEFHSTGNHKLLQNNRYSLHAFRSDTGGLALQKTNFLNYSLVLFSTVICIVGLSHTICIFFPMSFSRPVTNISKVNEYNK